MALENQVRYEVTITLNGEEKAREVVWSRQGPKHAERSALRRYADSYPMLWFRGIATAVEASQ